MPKQQQAKIGGNRAKSRQSYKNKATGRYDKQRSITERNRVRRLHKHIKRHPADKQSAKLLTS